MQSANNKKLVYLNTFKKLEKGCMHVWNAEWNNDNIMMLWKLLSSAPCISHFSHNLQNKSHRILAHPDEVHLHREASINILDYFYYTIAFFILGIWARNFHKP